MQNAQSHAHINLVHTLGLAYGEATKAFMILGLAFDVVLRDTVVSNRSTGKERRSRRLRTPIGFAAVRIARERSLKVKDMAVNMEWNAVPSMGRRVV